MVTARGKEKVKVWMCAACGKGHKERSAVRQQGGSYVCLAHCGLVEGSRVCKEKRPRDAGS